MWRCRPPKDNSVTCLTAQQNSSATLIHCVFVTAWRNSERISERYFFNYFIFLQICVFLKVPRLKQPYSCDFLSSGTKTTFRNSVCSRAQNKWWKGRVSCIRQKEVISNTVHLSVNTTSACVQIRRIQFLQSRLRNSTKVYRVKLK